VNAWEARTVKTECAHEQDVLDALAAQRWPARCDEHLRAHVNECALCADLIDVASALLEDQQSAWQEARVPPSSIVWWRAQVRAREEAARAAARPIAFIQGVAASMALWLAVAIWRALPWPALGDLRKLLAGLVPSVTFSLPDFATVATILPGALLLLALAAWLMLAPVAIYFAAHDE
jgi:hypothetical protein